MQLGRRSNTTRVAHPPEDWNGQVPTDPHPLCPDRDLPWEDQVDKEPTGFEGMSPDLQKCLKEREDPLVFLGQMFFGIDKICPRQN